MTRKNKNQLLNSNQVTCLIYCEDTFGKLFWKSLFEKLKNKGIIDSTIKITVKNNAKPCNNKTYRKVKTEFLDQTVKRVIIILDGDYKMVSLKQEEEEKIKHLFSDHLDKIILLFFRDEIEELYFYCVEKKYSGKASDEITRHLKWYKKNRLDKLLDYIDISKLKTHYLFQQLLPILNNCTNS